MVSAQQHPASPPFAARIIDMRALEERYRKIPVEDRIDYHAGLPFAALLTNRERATLHRRFPEELARDPNGPGATKTTCVAWDLRSRELAGCFIRFTDEVLERRLELAHSVPADAPIAALALTASGSIVALDRANADGVRRFQYRGGVGGKRGVREGTVTLSAPVVEGARVNLVRYNTSEVIALAIGRQGVSQERGRVCPEGTVLFLDAMADEADQAVVDEQTIELEQVRFRVLKDALVHAQDDDQERDFLIDRLERLASEFQGYMVDGDGGPPLKKVKRFETTSGTVYEVDHRLLRGRTDVIRRRAGRGEEQRFEGVSIGRQAVVAGAPLVMFLDRPGGRQLVACIPELRRVER